MTSPDQRPDDQRDPSPPPPPAAPKSASDRDRALAALHNFAKPQPKALIPGEEPIDEGPTQPASGPSGFVGMLSKGQGSGDTHVAAPAVAGDEGSIKSKHGLGVAREIMPAAPIPGGAREQAAAVAAPRKAAPTPKSGAYAVLLPVVAFVALLLLFIGIWALGAVVYMNWAKPTEPADVGYPLIHWSFAAGEAGDWTQGSRIMAWSMLACLPLAAILCGTVVAIWRRMVRRDATPPKR